MVVTVTVIHALQKTKKVPTINVYTQTVK